MDEFRKWADHTGSSESNPNAPLLERIRRIRAGAEEPELILSEDAKRSRRLKERLTRNQAKPAQTEVPSFYDDPMPALVTTGDQPETSQS